MWTLLLFAATVRSFAHMPLGISDRNKMVLWPGCEGRAEFSLHTKSVICVVRCKKEGMLLQPLRWCCIDCVIHHERDVREEQHHTYMWREHAIIECSWHGKKALYCCLLPQCEALRTCLCPQVSLSLQSSSAICHINFLIKAALDSAMTSPRKALIDKNAVYDLKCDDSIRNNFLHTC